jgi:nicotinamidase-related amidase
MTYGLIIIDMQQWFFRTEDRLAKLPWLLKGVNDLSAKFTSLALPVVIVRTIFSSDKNTWDQYMKTTNTAVLIENTPQAKDVDGLMLPDSCAHIIKTRHSTFVRTDFENMLRNLHVDSLLLAGAFLDGCVGLTAIDAWERDFKVQIAKEAVVSTDDTRGDSMLHFLKDEFNIVPIEHKHIEIELAAHSAK